MTVLVEDIESVWFIQYHIQHCVNKHVYVFCLTFLNMFL